MGEAVKQQRNWAVETQLRVVLFFTVQLSKVEIVSWREAVVNPVYKISFADSIKVYNIIIPV